MENSLYGGNFHEWEKETLLEVYSTLLEALPHPAMLIRGSDKIVLSANKVASEMGVKTGGQCWREFMKEEHLSVKDQQTIKKYPNLVPAKLGVKCTFCKGDECLTSDPSQNEDCLDAFGKKWDTYWILCGEDVFLHYAIDVTEKFEINKLLMEERQTMKNIFEGIEVGTWQLNIQTGELKINEKWANIIGYTVVELAPINVQVWTENMYPDDVEQVEKHLDQVFNRKIDNFDMEFRMVHKNGSLVWVNSRGRVNSWMADGRPLIASGIHMDFTDRKNMEQELRESEERYHNLFTFESDPLFLIDKITGGILEANASASNKYGYSHEELLKLKNTDMSAEPEKTKDATDAFDEGKTLIPIRYHKTKDGTVFPVEITASFIKMKDRDAHLIAVRDITERIKAETRINYLSYHDQLTGLYNRRFYEEELKRLDVERNYPLTLVMGDVNGLKLVNDAFGHIVGDELLRKVAEILKEACRSDDIIARIGGDEFVIILPKADSLETKKIIERIKKLSLNCKVGANSVSVSFGYETKNNKRQVIEDIFKGAEDYMYKHKLNESAKIKSSMIDLIMKKLYEKNDGELSHSIRVSEICQKISTSMNLSKQYVNQIRVAGLMHDIGKVSIDENVLMRIGKLGIDEWKNIKKHPEIGYRILNSSNDFLEIAVFVLEHHERWDGKGYPKGIKGSEISLPARIIAVAEAYDVMTADSNYNKCLTKEEALGEIKRCAGSQFDPEVVEAFMLHFG